MNSLVTTSLGDVRESELSIVTKMVDETEDAWVYAREATYIGTEHPEAVNTVVRRDVWVTVKRGLRSQVESSL